MDLVIDIYRVTRSFPARESHGLASQMRRASISIPSNIAEEDGRHTKKEFINYLHIAQGSLSELDTQVEIAQQLGYLNAEIWANVDGQMERIDKMLSGLIRHQSTNAGSPKPTNPKSPNA